MLYIIYGMYTLIGFHYQDRVDALLDEALQMKSLDHPNGFCDIQTWRIWRVYVLELCIDIDGEGMALEYMCAETSLFLSYLQLILTFDPVLQYNMQESLD